MPTVRGHEAREQIKTMELKQLFADEDAVSPVIGVILMVAITVILAAVIGTFVLGLGENVQDSAPQANFQFEYTGDFSTADAGTVTITHTGGEDVAASELSVKIGDADTITDVTTGWTDNWEDPVDTGDSLEVARSALNGESNDQTGQTVRVIWTSASGGTSNTIGQSTIPS